MRRVETGAAALVVVVLVTGCSKPASIADGGVATDSAVECASVDDTDLEATAGCFYRSERWKHIALSISRAHQAESTGAEADQRKRDYETVDVHLAKRERAGGRSYVAVSVTGRGVNGCTDTFTHTWTFDEGHWRMYLDGAREAEVAEKKLANGDYSGAAQATEDWLKIDPLSIDAYQTLGFAIMRGAIGKPIDDAVRAALSISPQDSTALSLAVAGTRDVDVKESYLDRFRDDDCTLPTAVFNIAVKMPPATALEFLNRFARVKDPFLLMARAEALGSLGRAKEVPALLTAETTQQLRADLDGKDPAFAATWAGTVAEALLAGGEKAAARDWVSYGLVKDPSDKKLARLLRSTKPK